MQPQTTEPKLLRAPHPRLAAIAVALAALVIVLAVAIRPHAILDKADLAGYAVCHRIPERSFILAGRQLPLCARCTGTFLGALLGLAAFLALRRGKASHLPSLPVLGALLLFVVAWGLDGLNSYLTFFPDAPHAYEPRNWLRLATGTLNGLALIGLVWPIWNFTLWRRPADVPVMRGIGELAAILPAAALLVWIVQAQIGGLLYPLAILSSLGLVTLLMLLNSMLAAIALGREGFAQTGRQVLVPLCIGLGLALVELSSLVWLRDTLTARFGMPF